ncbi:MAG: class I SAM-dependent methyltransferase [Leptolyngbyaceae bacterium]|nr:class I SAM-dependent methyltransferase [Leptolyngbyaceae bacterium]
MSNFVFNNNNGVLEFIGDFDGLYQNEENPWGQIESVPGRYAISRQRQVEILRNGFRTTKDSDGRLLDLGCGLGATTQYFSNHFDVIGADKSRVAIDRALKLYPGYEFHVLDVASPTFQSSLAQLDHNFSVVVLNQLLWYVIDNFDQVLRNLRLAVQNGGFCLLSNFIFDDADQKFAREFFEGHDDILRWLRLVSLKNGWYVGDYVCSKLDQTYYDFHAILSPTP